MTETNEPRTSQEVKTRSVEEVKADTKDVSSEVLNLIAVRGEVSEPGPGVAVCEGRDRDKFFRMIHPWTLTAPTGNELERAMERLKEELPKRGWKIVEYGRNSSRAKTLELTADHTGKEFSVNVEFWAESGEKRKPMLVVNVVSACYSTRGGERVREY